MVSYVDNETQKSSIIFLQVKWQNCPQNSATQLTLLAYLKVFSNVPQAHTHATCDVDWSENYR